MSSCTVCSSRSALAVNEALRRGEALTSIARRFSLSRFAIARHRDAHVYDPGAEPSTMPSIDERLIEIEAALAGALQAAHRKGSMQGVVAASRELTKTLEVLHKLRVEAAAERESVELTYHEEMRCVRQALVELLGPTQPELLEVFESSLQVIRTDELARKLDKSPHVFGPSDVYE